MDPQLLQYYNRELEFVREMGAEYAHEFPKIAGRLGLDGLDCADPYVERLLESFAFLSARLQLRLEAEYPRFTEHLLDIVYPHYLAAIPSMTVVQFNASPKASLDSGALVVRGSSLRSILGKGQQTACEYRTAHDVTLWPIAITEAEYFSNVGSLVDYSQRAGVRPKAGLRFVLQTHNKQPFNELSLGELTVFLQGRDGQPVRLYEQLLGNCCGVIARPSKKPTPWRELLRPESIVPVGFADDEALLPQTERGFSGYRLLQEYFAFPDRYMFVRFTDLQRAVALSVDDTLEIVVLFDRYDPELENVVGPANLQLNCSPALNLFKKRVDRLAVTEQTSELHVVADRTRPLDFEINQIQSVNGYGSGTEKVQTFLPFYSCTDLSHFADHQAYFTQRRERRVLSGKQRRAGPRSSYIGSELYLALVDAFEAPYSADLKQLEIEALCTNRDLPLHMVVGKGSSDFSPDLSAPVDSIRCLKGPTAPKPSLAHRQGETAWRLINHLSLNYLSLVNASDGSGASALRELLALYGDRKEAWATKQIDGIRSIESETITRRMPVPGPIAFGNGLGIRMTLEDSAFEGTGVFLLGAVLEQFFARYVSINSFTEFTLETAQRGKVMTWPARIGQQKIA